MEYLVCENCKGLLQKVDDSTYRCNCGNEKTSKQKIKGHNKYYLTMPFNLTICVDGNKCNNCTWEKHFEGCGYVCNLFGKTINKNKRCKKCLTWFKDAFVRHIIKE